MRFLVVVAALLSGALGMVPQARAAFPGSNGRIVYVARPALCTVMCAAHYRLFTANADGTDPLQVGSNVPLSEPSSFMDSSGKFSPDGTLIAFDRGTVDGTGSISANDVHVMRADGTGMRHIAANAFEPTWLPDGRIAVRTATNGTVSIITADGQRSETFLPNFNGSGLAWSPDGTRIAFERGSDIWVMNADGGSPRNLTATQSLGDGSPDWSPDGTTIVWGCQIPLFVNVCAMNADGSGVRSLTSSTQPERSSGAFFSPDGKRLLFARSFTSDGAYLPYEMARDGSGAKPQFSFPAQATYVTSWQPLPVAAPPGPAGGGVVPVVDDGTKIATPAALGDVSPPALTPGSTPAPAQKAPAPAPKTTLSIPYRGGYRISLSHKKACNGKVTLTLRKGAKTLQSRRTTLDARCRYTTTFTVKRAELGRSKRLTVIVRFHGNRYLGATTNRFKVPVPSS